MKFDYPDAYSKYGADKGRRECHEGDPVGKMHLQQVPINQGGYDPGGAYWGIGMPLWRYADSGDEFGDGHIDGYLRAWGREDAKAQILAVYPTARFYR